ncbi:MAG: hypothetical protein RLZZ618_1732 [Pseudomonadota bacterium]|jgi:diguanylate cyclase (GGDEF)-like protein
MNVPPPTLLFSSTLVMLLAAALMALFGKTQRTYGGYGSWTAAQALAAVGLGLHAWRDSHPGLLPLANLLLMQWPVLLLTGFRHFYPRETRGGAPLIDWLLLGCVYAVWLVSWVAQAELALRVAAFSMGMIVLHLYAAISLWRLNVLPESPAPRALMLMMFGCVAAHTSWLGCSLLGIQSPSILLMWGGVIGAACAMVMLYLALLLTCDRTQQELAASQHQLRALANIDPLTDVPNRRHFHELAQQAVAAAAPGTAALLMIDIDHFKRINDLLGHKAGDAALRDVAHSMRESLRTGDVPGRLGGDEFVALLPDTSVQDAIAVADRIVRPLRASSSLPLSLSFGVVHLQAGESITDALHRADQALYEAKRQGRNCAVVATGNDDEPVFTESMPLGLMPG